MMRVTEMKMCLCAITDILKEMFLFLLFLFPILSLIYAGVIKAFHTALITPAGITCTACRNETS